METTLRTSGIAWKPVIARLTLMMKLQPEVEAELKAVEQWIESMPGQKAGPARLRGLRSVLELQQLELVRKMAKIEALVLELQTNQDERKKAIAAILQENDERPVALSKIAELLGI
jgi:hypothetical protein